MPNDRLSALRAPGTAPVHQIGIVVASCEEAVPRYTAVFGYPEWRRSSFGREDVQRMTLRGADASYSMRLAFAGTAPELELIEPAGGESRDSEMVPGRGEGLHHLPIVRRPLREGHNTPGRPGLAHTQSRHRSFP